MKNLYTIEVQVYSHRVQIKLPYEVLSQIKEPQILFEKIVKDLLHQMFETVFQIGFHEMYKKDNYNQNDPKN